MYRYAIYYAPPPYSALWRAGTAWLGRDPETQRTVEFPRVEGYTRDRLNQLSRAAQRYAFHATLVAPFQLVHGCDAHTLFSHAERFCATRCAFEMPPMAVKSLGEFLALRPISKCSALDDLAAASVVHFNELRAPLGDDELARRRAVGLTERQEHHLKRYGYPYVMEDFRFHMTLTDRLNNADRATLSRWLSDYFALLTPVTFDALAVFAEPEAGANFVLLKRFPFIRMNQA